MKTKFNDIITEHFLNKQFVRITREKGDFKETSNGYIVGYAPEFILLQECSDFELGGYSIIPRATITKIRYNKYDKFYDKIMRKEKVLKKVGKKWKIDLKSWNSIFKSIQNTKLNAIIECEEPEKDYFYIGAIKDVKKKSVSILPFDAQGNWEKAATKQPYEAITKVTFDDRYVNVFSKYLAKPKK